MKDDWIVHCLELSAQPADIYSGCRKILFDRSLTFGELFDADDPIVLEDCGYTRNKLSHLTRGYLHEESRDFAIMLWNLRRQKTSYGSVGFTTYNHFVKNNMEKKSKRASVMGPCIQSVTEGMEFQGLTCHFANVTIHPQYFVTLIPHLEEPLRELDRLREIDPYFYDWVVKWTSRYLVPEHFRGIQKFAQAMRVKVDADLRIKGWRRRELIKYLEKNHPGHSRAYNPKDEEGDEE
jgi:hypothetical protein